MELTYIVLLYFLTIKGVIMKLCIDCKHYKSRSCFHPSIGVDLVEGGLKSEYCAVMRLDTRACKPEGLLFEPMEAVVYDIAALFPDTNFPNIRGQNQ